MHRRTAVRLSTLIGLILCVGAPSLLADDSGDAGDTFRDRVSDRAHPRPDYVWPYDRGPHYGRVDRSIHRRPGVVHTLVGSFDLTAGTPDLPDALRARPDLESSTPRYYVALLDPASIAARGLQEFEAEIVSRGCGIVGRTAVAGLVIRADRACLETLRGTSAVLALEPYHPAFKLSPWIGRVPLTHPARGESRTHDLEVQLFPGEDAQAVATTLRAMDGRVLEVGTDRVRVRLHRARLTALASIEAVQVVHERAAVFPFGEETTATIQTGAFMDGAVPYHDAGIRGDGGGVVMSTQVLMVLDDGISVDAGDLSDTCVDSGWTFPIAPGHRKILDYTQTQPYGGQGDILSCDQPGDFTHGHVVSSVALGNVTDHEPCGWWNPGPGDRTLDGVAPRAKLVFFDATLAAERFEASLSGGEVVPPSTSTATGMCDFSLEGPNLLIQCTHDLPSPLNGLIRFGAPGVNGPLRYVLGDPTSPILEWWDGLTASVIQELYDGDLYIEIRSTIPGQSIRGQIGLSQSGCETAGGEAVHALLVGEVYNRGAGTGSMKEAHDDHGARTFNFSWGTVDNPVYGIHATNSDRFLFDHPEAMLFMAAGNAGADGLCDNSGTPCQSDTDCLGQGGAEICLYVTDPATSKNAVVVGATFSPNPRGNPDQDARWPESSRGPAGVTGRIAPLLMAPGADDGSSADTQTAMACRSSDLDQDNPVECDLVEGKSGTSYASAAAAGASMLVRDYFAQGFFPDGTVNDPGNSADQVPALSGALVKAILVASADWMNDPVDPTLPGANLSAAYRFNNEQGYGRIQLSNVLPLADWPGAAVTGLIVHDGGIAGGTSALPLPPTISTLFPNFHTAAFQVCDDTQELRVALAWIEDVDAAGAGVLENDLDLRLTSPSGKVYLGNFFTDDLDRSGTLDTGEDCEDFAGVANTLDESRYSLPINTCVTPAPLEDLRDTLNPTEAIFLSPNPDLNFDVDGVPITEDGTCTITTSQACGHDFDCPAGEFCFLGTNQIEPGTWTVAVSSDGTGVTNNQGYTVVIAGGACIESTIRVLNTAPCEYRLKVLELDEPGDPGGALFEAEITSRTEIQVIDPASGVVDVEGGFPFTQVNEAALRFESELLQLALGSPTPWDGILQIQPGFLLSAIYYDELGGVPFEQREARALFEGCSTPGETVSLNVDDYDEATGNLDVKYVKACESLDHTIVYGPLQDVSFYGYSGQECNIGDSGSYDLFNPGGGSYFFLVVGNNGSATEGSYGLDSSGAERPEDVSDPDCSLTQNLGLRCD